VQDADKYALQLNAEIAALIAQIERQESPKP
jgi:hypothetical protein